MFEFADIASQRWPASSLAVAGVSTRRIEAVAEGVPLKKCRASGGMSPGRSYSGGMRSPRMFRR